MPPEAPLAPGPRTRRRDELSVHPPGVLLFRVTYVRMHTFKLPPFSSQIVGKWLNSQLNLNIGNIMWSFPEAPLDPPPRAISPPSKKQKDVISSPPGTYCAQEVFSPSL